MSREDALRAAISLVKVPSQVRAQRIAPLPDGILLLLNVAARDQDAERDAESLTGRPLDLLREASEFFIAQVLLYPDANSYRVLGGNASAPAGELRTHMAALMRWLHPDLDENGDRALMAKRVLRAWEDLKSPERRQAYDAALARSQNHGRARPKRPTVPRTARPDVEEGAFRRIVRSVVSYFSNRQA